MTRRAVRLGYIEATGGYAPAARSHGSPKMTDRYERIREALAKGPTPGPWHFGGIIWAGSGMGYYSVVNADNTIICDFHVWIRLPLRWNATRPAMAMLARAGEYAYRDASPTPPGPGHGGRAGND